MEKDVVCGVQVDESTVTNSSEHGGRTFYFCSTACKKRFDRKPEAYVNEADRIRVHETAVFRWPSRSKPR
jgi:Cu+-exporting ATPase